MSLLSMGDKGFGEGQSRSAKLRREFRERVVEKISAKPVSRQTARAQLRDAQYEAMFIPGNVPFTKANHPLPRNERRKLARAKAAGAWREIRKLRDGVEKVARAVNRVETGG